MTLPCRIGMAVAWSLPGAFLIVVACGCRSGGAAGGLRFREVPPAAPDNGELPFVMAIADPVEGFNRISFMATDGTVRWVVAPGARAYRFVIPRAARRSVENFAENLRFPVRFVNASLQGKFVAALEESARFVTNSTIGIAGLFDPASHLGLSGHEEDFGQTLGAWGVPEGFYFFVPLLGPSSGRDAAGALVDRALDPATFVPGLGLLFFLNEFSFSVDDYEVVTRTWSDPYVVLRDLWAARRSSEVEDFVPPAGPGFEPTPTLGALKLRDPGGAFYRRREEIEVSLPTTGRELPASVWIQEGPAPLVYLLLGIGGYRDSELARAVGAVLFSAGYSVVTVSSPFHPEFLRAGGSGSVPGYTPVDARDVGIALATVDRHLAREEACRVTSRCVLGLSLGGLHALVLASLDRGTPGFPSVTRFVAVNPPVSPYDAVRQLDAFYNAPLEWAAERRRERIRETLMKAARVLGGDTRGQLPFGPEESEYLIGLSYRQILRDALHAMAFQRPLGVLAAPYTWFWREDLYDEISAYSFQEYVEALVLPYIARLEGRRSVPPERLEAAGLRPHEEALSSDTRVRVIANADDFVLSPGDLDWLEAVFGERLRVFPSGGHLGNLYRRDVQHAILQALGSEEQPAESPEG